MKSKQIIIAGLAGLSLLMISSCWNQGGGGGVKDKGMTTKSAKEQYLTEEVRIKMDSVFASFQKLPTLPLLSSIKDGDLTLAEKEKMVKPDYLVSPEITKLAITEKDKFVAMGFLVIDKRIAELYEMPVEEYNNAMSKLMADIGYTASSEFTKEGAKPQDGIAAMYQECYHNNSLDLFWMSTTVNLIEILFVVTQNTDKFLEPFTDENAADISSNFKMLHEAILALMPYHPEMEDLQAVLQPLYRINAENKDQLREQLTDLKVDIEAARDFLLEMK